MCLKLGENVLFDKKKHDRFWSSLLIPSLFPLFASKWLKYTAFAFQKPEKVGRKQGLRINKCLLPKMFLDRAQIYKHCVRLLWSTRTTSPKTTRNCITECLLCYLVWRFGNGTILKEIMRNNPPPNPCILAKNVSWKKKISACFSAVCHINLLVSVVRNSTKKNPRFKQTLRTQPTSQPNERCWAFENAGPTIFRKHDVCNAKYPMLRRKWLLLQVHCKLVCTPLGFFNAEWGVRWECQ